MMTRDVGHLWSLHVGIVAMVGTVVVTTHVRVDMSGVSTDGHHVRMMMMMTTWHHHSVAGAVVKSVRRILLSERVSDV